MLSFHAVKTRGSTYSRIHHRSPKSFNVDAISSQHILKSMWEENLILDPEKLCDEFLKLNMTCYRIIKFRIFTVSCLRGNSMDIKIRNKLIEIKYCISDERVIFVRNYWRYSLSNIHCSRDSFDKPIRSSLLHYTLKKHAKYPALGHST